MPICCSRALRDSLTSFRIKSSLSGALSSSVGGIVLSDYMLWDGSPSSTPWELGAIASWVLPLLRPISTCRVVLQYISSVSGPGVQWSGAPAVSRTAPRRYPRLSPVFTLHGHGLCSKSKKQHCDVCGRTHSQPQIQRLVRAVCMKKEAHEVQGEPPRCRGEGTERVKGHCAAYSL